ncbi:MAG: hypothetical protein IT521_01680 [Burkholderiales bacterium]|nr:hypothetical protein [Burkholderiales bacterium]
MPGVLAACAQLPAERAPAPAPPATPVAPTASAPLPEAIARYRRQADAARQAGDLALTATNLQIAVLLAPDDATSRRELAAVRTAIAGEVRNRLAAGNAAMSAGDLDHAYHSMLRVLALDPGQEEAAKTLREIDRRRLTRIQAGRAARVRNAEAAAPKVTSHAPVASVDAVDGYDLEQALEIFGAGDTTGGLRDLRAYVGANPGNRAERQRIGTIVAERARELENRGAKEQALGLYEQASLLRGDGNGPWTARMAPLKKSLSQEYFEKGSRVFRTDLTQAIRLLETSVRYDPGNTQASIKLREARTVREKFDKIK